MASQQDLTNIAISSGFATLIHTEDSGGVTSSFTNLYDGDGTLIPMAVSTTAVKIIDGAYDFDIASHDGTNGLKLGGTLVTASASEINYLDVSSIGSAQASKALILDSNLDISGIRNLTATGTIQALNFTATGDTAIGNSVANDTLAINSTITTNLVFEGSTDNSFETTLAITDPTADRTLTLPDATDTLVGKATTDTLTNKTLDIDNNTLSNVEVDNLKSGVLDTDISSVSGSDDTLASAKAIKTYVDAQDANIASDTLTFTNKTFDVEASGNSISNIDVADLKSGVLDTDISSVSSSDDTLASAKAIKTYIDSQVTAQDLDFQGDSGGALSIDLDSETLDIAGGTGIDTSGSSNTLTVAIDSTVATLTGSQTLTNKTLTSPDINGGSADALTSLTVANNVDIGNHTLTANGLTIDGTFTDGALSIASGSITNAVNGTFSGTVQAEQLTTTDDATISDQLSVDGTMTISTGSIVDSSGAISFSSNNLSTSGTLGAGAGTLTSLSVTDGNITNVGDIALDTISADDTAITFSSPVNFNSQATTNVNIDSGNIDGATIATSNITVGSSKTLDVSAGTLTLADNQISGDKVEGGTIASTTITALTTAGITASSNLDIGDFTIRANNFLADSQTATQVAFYGTNGVLSGDSDMTFSGSTLSVTDLTVSGTLTTTGSVQEVSTTNLNVQDPLILLNKYDSQPTNNAFDAGFIIKRGSGDSAPANVGFIFDESADQFALIDTSEDGTTAGNVSITDYENLRIGALTADDASTFTSTISTASGSTIGNLTLADGSITSGSGALSFGNENLSTSGTLSAGAITGTSFIIGSADISEAELEIIDGATITTDELNILDGDTSATSTTVADADRVVLNDGGTMKQVAVTDLSAYFDDEITAMPNLTSVGTLTALQIDNININGNTIVSSDTDGNINLTPNGSGEVNISKVDIDSGDISGTDITVGSGKTLNVSAGTLTLANDQISGDAINGGTIGSITINALAGNLGLGDNNITAVGSIALDSIESASTGNGFDLTLLNNKADALEIKEGSNAYMTFITTTGSEEIQIDKALDINASVDMSSTLTVAGDVNFDSNTLFVDASENRVGIGLSNPVSTFDVTSAETANTANFTSTSGATNITFKSSSTLIGQLEFISGGDCQLATRTANSPLVFKENNVEKLRITSDKVMFSADAKVDAGNTRDLGTSGTRWKDLYLQGNADVAGNGLFGGTITIGSVSDNGDALITNGASSGRYDVLTVKEDGATRWEVSFEGESSTNSLTFGSNVSGQQVSDGGILTLLPDGNVGIGTSSPSSLLHLKETDGDANAGPILTLQRDNSASEDNNDVLGEIQFQGSDSANTTTNVYAQINAQIEDISHTSEDGRLHLQTQVAGTMTDTLVCNSGSVGIGISSPTALLHVKNTTNNDAPLRIQGGTSTETFDFRIKGVASPAHFSTGIFSMESANSGLAFYTRDSSGNSNERMVIQGDGKVGIGTSSPASKLHINDGSLRVVGSNERILVIEDGGQNSVEIGHSTSSTHDGFIALTNDSGTTQVLLTSGTNDSHISGNVTVGGSATAQRSLHVQGSDGICISDGDRDRVGLIPLAPDANSGGLDINVRSGGSSTHAVRIDSNGQLGIGVTNLGARLHVRVNSAGALSKTRIDGDDGSSDGGAVLALAYNTTEKWNILTRNQTSVGSAFSLQILDDDGNDGVFLNQDATSFSANSDERMKENIVELESATDKLNTLRCVNFNMKHDSSEKKRIGLIAQDVYKVYPEATTGTPDSEYSYNPSNEGSSHINAMAVQYTELIAPMIKAIQELSAKVTELEERCNCE